MAAKKAMSKSAGPKPPSAGAVALSRRVAQVMTAIPIEKQAMVAKAVSGANSYAALSPAVKKLIDTAEKGAK